MFVPNQGTFWSILTLLCLFSGFHCFHFPLTKNWLLSFNCHDKILGLNKVFWWFCYFNFQDEEYAEALYPTSLHLEMNPGYLKVFNLYFQFTLRSIPVSHQNSYIDLNIRTNQFRIAYRLSSAIVIMKLHWFEGLLNWANSEFAIIRIILILGHKNVHPCS